MRQSRVTARASPFAAAQRELVAAVRGGQAEGNGRHPMVFCTGAAREPAAAEVGLEPV